MTGKKILKTSTILLVGLLAISVIQSLAPLAGANVNSSNSALTISNNPLSNEQIKAMWPNLPSAKTLYENEGCVFIDLRYSGKQASSMTSSLPDPRSPTVIDMKLVIANRTSPIPDFVNGGFNYYMPQIWLQYDENIWVKVPHKYLMTSSVSSATINEDLDVQTWSVGMYSNPSEIAGNNDIWGVCSFGEWNIGTFGSIGDYVGTCVLSAVTNRNIGLQNAMCIDPIGRWLVYNEWNLTSGNIMDTDKLYLPGALSGNLYNVYIKYNGANSAWQLWWNWTLIWSFAGDLGTRVEKEAQPYVVVESNDFDSTDFIGFSASIGGSQSGYTLAATCFLFNGAWKPVNSGDYAPAGYVYLGSSTVNGIRIGTTSPPSTWGSYSIGISSSSREVIEIGASLTQRSYGYTLWTYGTI